MGRVKQGIKIKSARNNNAKYKLRNTKYTYTSKNSTKTTKKYSYISRTVSTVNGKKKYIYHYG